MTNRTIDFWPDHPLQSYEVQRILAMAPTGGADAGEVSWALLRIDPADRESWRAAWSDLAEETERLADGYSHPKSRRDGWLRACNYWRQAAFFIPLSDPDRVRVHKRSQAAFRKALPHLDGVGEVVEIPYDGSFLDGYLILPESDGPAPVMIFGGTVDSTAEEKYFAIGRRLVERDVGVLLFDGPGQGASLLERGHLARHDYEVPVSVTLDWLSRNRRVDIHAVGLISWGDHGKYSLRAAAFEPRLALAVAWNMSYSADDLGGPPVPEGVESVADWVARIEAGEFGDPVAVRYIMEWAVARAGGSLEALRDLHLKNTLSPEMLGRIRCPVLIVMSEEDLTAISQDFDPYERALREVASEDKTLVRFPAEAPGSRYVQVDGMERLRPIVLDWIAARVGRRPVPQGPVSAS